MPQTSQVSINRSLSNKTVDKFYVSFFQMDNNVSNILGREVQSIERPTITFNEYEVRNKGIKQIGEARLEYQPITINFFDDSSSLVNKAIYQQVLRQTGKSTIKHDTTQFNIGVKVFTTNDIIAEEFELIDCHISNISHSEQIYADSTNNIISVTVSFNDLCYNFPAVDGPTNANNYIYLVDAIGDNIVDEQGNSLVV
jgi:hypothetical protein